MKFQEIIAENYRVLMKDIKEDLKKWKDIFSQIGRLNIKKTLILPQLIYRFSAISIKNPTGVYLYKKQ